MRTARLPDAIAVDSAIAAVMHTLAERLTSGETHELLQGMPRELRPMFERCVLQRDGGPTVKLDRAAFLERVRRHLGVTPAHAELVCEAVFAAVRAELPEKLVRDVAHQLPRGLVQLWLAAPAVESTASGTLSPHEARRVIEEEIEDDVPLPPGVTIEDVFSAVMCSFSERLSRGEARELLLGLPDTVRPLVDRCMVHRAEPPFVFGRDELLQRVEGLLHVDESHAEALVRAVFAAVKRVLPEKAVLDVSGQLPADLLELWDGERSSRQAVAARVRPPR